MGFFFEVDTLFGGHINTTVQKSEEEKAAFGLHVDVQGEGFLNYWDPKEKKYQRWPCPGKVDAYRFMTFYLAPKPQNFDQFFEKIVDPEWLNGQGKYAGEYGPNARALREARFKPNEVWRVSHRVTYVSRIPPRFEPTPVEAVPKDVRRPANIEANIGLIQEIETIKHLLPPIPDESHLMILGRAVDRLLFGNTAGDGQGQSELEKIVPWWADRDEDVKREIRQDTMTYLKAFYESDLTPPEIGEDKQRVTEGLQVLYTFEEGKGKTLHDVSGVGQPLNLIVKDKAAVSWLPGGLAITGETLVATPKPATKLIEAAKASNEITFEAWVKPADAAQGGPARIVTLSVDTHERNFTLGQDGKHYQTRLRATPTDLNGTEQALEAGEVVTDDLSHLVYARDVSGRARFYLNGVEVGSRNVRGSFSNWDDGYRFGLGNEFTLDRPWRGELHLVAIYDRALGQAEVEQNYNAGAGTTM
ncbi:MAG: LamG domain-containing protein [Anaerolineae bacterium]|nr:MAG: LamG domain-containing protein [Anaerolineae bacterium]